MFLGHASAVVGRDIYGVFDLPDGARQKSEIAIFLSLVNSIAIKAGI